MPNYFSEIFGSSPVGPIQKHMEICYQAAKELICFFDYVAQGDWENAQKSRVLIVQFENQADGVKKQIRSHLPKSLFMPVARADLLELVLVQDRIPNRARDVSGLVIGRNMEIPEAMHDLFLAFVSRNADAAKKARKTIRELDELYETGFRGAEVELVESLVDELDQIENDTDDMQAQLRAQLHSIEESLPPVNVMFLYRVIELTGDIGDMAERIGRRLEVMIAH